MLVAAFFMLLILCSQSLCSIKPAISEDCSDIEHEQIYKGSSKTLKCSQRRQGVPFNFIWMKSEKRLEKIGEHCEKLISNQAIRVSSDDFIRLRFSTPHCSQEYNGSKIVLNDVSSNDAGYYTCLVNNSFGCDYKSKKLDVMENATNVYKVLDWNVSYTHWNASNTCPKMRITYSTDFMLKSNDRLILQLVELRNDHAIPLDRVKRYKEFVCSMDGHSATCLTSDISTELTNRRNYMFNLFLIKNNGYKNFIQTIIKKVRYEDIRGKLDLKVLNVDKRSVDVVWYRPWLNLGCDGGEKFRYFQEKLCLSDCDCDHESEPIHIGRENYCFPANQRETGVIYECMKTVKNLKPNKSYSYRLRYSLGGIYVEKFWSAWSDCLKFTTKSERPASPHINCMGASKCVVVSWKVKSNSSSVKIDHFQVQANMKEHRVQAIYAKDDYELKIPALEEQYVLVSACSSEECSTSSKTCHPDTSIRKFVISFVVFGVLVLVLVLVGVYLCNAEVFLCNIGKSKRSMDHQLLELITPRNIIIES